MADDVVGKIRGQFPFPWTQHIHPNGQVYIVDATGKEVALFAMTDFVCLITNVMATKKPEDANETVSAEAA